MLCDGYVSETQPMKLDYAEPEVMFIQVST